MLTAIPDREYNSTAGKSRGFILDNGAKVITEFSHYWGDMVTRIDLPDGTYWHCSNGLASLPDFAKPWVEEDKGHKLVRPRFTVNWEGV